MDSRNTFISKLVIGIYKYGNKVYYSEINKFIKKILILIYKILDLIFVKIIAGAEIPAQAKIGENLYLPHGGRGVIIHPGAKIGDNLTIYHQATIGSDKIGNAGAPVIGNNVFIGTGAKILGRIVIGNNVKIGANAVVLKDIDDYCTAVGIPAKVINKKVK